MKVMSLKSVWLDQRSFKVNAYQWVTKRNVIERQEKRAFVRLTIKKTTAKDHDDDLDADYSGQFWRRANARNVSFFTLYGG